MAASRTLTVVLAGDAKGLQNSLDRSSNGFAQFGKAAAVAGAAGAAALIAVGVKGVANVAKLQTGLTEVRTLLPELSDAGFKKLRNDVLAFSDEMGIATDKAVPALYQAISAGVPPNNVIDFMKTATAAAVGGVTELETAVDGISSVVNAYGSGVIGATKASDLMFTAVKLGKTNFEQLSSSLFNVVPIAAAANVEFSNVAAAVARLTAQGTPTRVATTQLRASIQGLLAPSAEAQTLMRDLGLSFDATRLSEIGLSGAFNELYDATGGNIDQLKKILGSIEGVQAVLGLTGKNAEAFADALKAMEDSTGATNKAFETMNNTLERKWEVVMNRINNLLTKLGIEIMPFVTAAVDTLLPVIEGLSMRFIKELVPGVQAFIDQVGKQLAPTLEILGGFITDNVLPALQGLWDLIQTGVAAVRGWLSENEELVKSIGIATGILLGLKAALAVVAIAVGVVAAVVGLLLSPVLLIGAAIVGLTAFFVHLYRSNDEFRALIDEKVIPTLQAFAGWINDNVVPALQALGGWINDNVLPAVRDFAAMIAENATSALQAFAGWITDNVLPALEDLWELIQTGVLAVRDWLLENRVLIESIGITVAIVLGLKVALAVLALGVGALAAVVAIATGAVGALVAVLGVLLSPVVLITAAIVGLIALFVHLYRTNDEFRALIDEKVIPAFKNLAGWINDNVLPAFCAFASGVGTAVGIVLGDIKRLIDFIQSIELPSFELPSFGGGATGRVPRGARTDIPDLAEGGIVRARPGGRIVRVAERGRDEIIAPLPPGGGIGGGNTYNFYIDAPGGDPEKIAAAIFPALEALERNGSITRVTT